MLKFIPNTFFKTITFYSLSTMFGGQHTKLSSHDDDKEIHKNLMFLLKLLVLVSVQNMKAVEIISYVSFVALLGL